MPEWGIGGNNTGDDSYFVTQMTAWLKTYNYTYACYWDTNSAYRGMLSNKQYPTAGTAYIAGLKS
jgi:hypothetical protein